ncbi:MAG TPA: hypothetical protein VF853_09740 [Candidatus Deferrimicrobiaceae bacterium]
MNGTSWKGKLLVTVSVFLAIVAIGGPEAAGADGNVTPEGGAVPSNPCGSPVGLATLGSGNAGPPVPAAPADRGLESPRANGEEPRPGDAPCTIETLRKRAARARIS